MQEITQNELGSVQAAAGCNAVITSLKQALHSFRVARGPRDTNWWHGAWGVVEACGKGARIDPQRTRDCLAVPGGPPRRLSDILPAHLFERGGT